MCAKGRVKYRYKPLPSWLEQRLIPVFEERSENPLSPKCVCPLKLSAHKRNKKGYAVKENTCLDYIIFAEIVIIGFAETAHLTAVFLKLPFHLCAMLFMGLLGGGCVTATLFFFIRRRFALTRAPKGTEPILSPMEQELTMKQDLTEPTKSIVPGREPEPTRGMGTLVASLRKRILPEDKAEWTLAVLLGLLVLSQLLLVCSGDYRYRRQDMTMETVGSFLATDGIYQVNPMTGRPYTAGLPLRLEILCLPTLYASLCRATGLNPEIVVGRLVPALVLVSSYAAFAALGRCLFTRKKRLCFLLAVSFLFWTGTYLYGMDGFGVVYCGWRGVTVRNCVLLPWLLSRCLRRRWASALLCCLAECCIVWTYYGLGVCLFVAAGMALAQRFCGKSVPKDSKAASSAGKGAMK